MTVTNGDRRKL